MSYPPVLVERILLSLTAPSPVRDDILGDLAEEFARRTEQDGASRARRWYVREAARTAPHLARMSIRSFSLREAAGLAAAVFGACAVMAVVWQLSVNCYFHVDPDLRHQISETLPIDPRLLLGPIFTAGLGFVASSLARKTPMIASAAAGALWCALPILASLQHRFYRHLLQDLIIIITFSLIGGLLHTRLIRPSRPAHARPFSGSR